MIINLVLLLASGLCLFWFYKSIRKEGLLWIAKGSLQVGIFILFFFGFINLFNNLPNNPYVKLIFCITYIWCTVGINVNFMLPLIGLISEKIDKNK